MVRSFAHQREVDSRVGVTCKQGNNSQQAKFVIPLKFVGRFTIYIKGLHIIYRRKALDEPRSFPSCLVVIRFHVHDFSLDLRVADSTMKVKPNSAFASDRVVDDSILSAAI